MQGADSALSLMLGLVCERCDAYNDGGASTCTSCGAPLSADGADAPAAIPNAPASSPDAARAGPPPSAAASTATGDAPAWMSAPSGAPLATAFALPKVDLAVLAAAGATMAAPLSDAASASASQLAPAAAQCPSCAAPMEAADKFCRNCGTRRGAPVPVPATAQPSSTPATMASSAPPPATMVMPAFQAAQQRGALAGLPLPGVMPGGAPSATMFFGAATAERSAKLILVRGASAFGSQWRLQGGETVVGRSQGMVLFPDDDTIAARHCALVFRGADLFLVPYPTRNGVCLRIRVPTRLEVGSEFVVGAQRLVVLGDDRPRVTLDPGANDTKLLGSVMKAQPATSLLRVGVEPALHEVFHRAQRVLTLGRNNCDVNFPRDSFVSERHAQITNEGGQLTLEDLRSRNGTYLRAQQEVQLHHGDLLLLGDKVLRVELPR